MSLFICDRDKFNQSLELQLKYLREMVGYIGFVQINEAVEFIMQRDLRRLLFNHLSLCIFNHRIEDNRP